MTERYSVPRMRQKNAAVSLWNSEYPEKLIDKHIVDICANDERVFYYKRENVWIINYDQLELVLDEYMKTHAYIPEEELKRQGIKTNFAATREDKAKIIGR